MPLTLTLIDPPSLPPAQTMQHTFVSGGTIGRAPNNDWVLHDEQRIVSGQHAVVREEHGRYTITDTSTNGVFLNDDSLPLGKGNSAPLHHGDRITLGDFRCSVSIDSVDGSLLAGVLPEQSPASPFPSSAHAPDTDQALDPLAFFGGPEDGAPAPPPPTANAVHTAPELQSPLQDHFEPPGFIPDDWDAGAEAAPAPPTTSPPPGAELIPEDFDPGTPPLGPEPAPRPAPTAPAPPPPATTNTDDMARAFLRGAGMTHPPDNPAAFMEEMGQVFRDTLTGLMAVLRARSQIKSEFRMSVTQIQARENNPLKFSVSPEEALGHMLSADRSGYMTPAKAVRDSFTDLEAHQLAVMAGMQAALQVLFRRFDPAVLEEEFSRTARGGVLGGNKKSKYWELYREYFAKLAKEAADDFAHIFGEEFARAYEEQVRKIAAARH